MIKQEYPQYGENGKFLIKVKEGKVFVVGPKGGENTPLFKADGRTINPKISKTDMKVLGPHWTEVVDLKDEEIEEANKALQGDQRVANDENEEPFVRDRARERITENTERITQLNNEREQILEKVPLWERIKEIFTKYGWTLKVLFIAAGTVIGAVSLYLITTMKNGANAVSNGLKEIGKKVGSILPGLLGAIVSFIFRAAGQVISFLGKNAWLLILAVAAFLIERLTKKWRGKAHYVLAQTRSTKASAPTALSALFT